MYPILYKHKDGVGLRKIELSDLSDLQDLKAESWWGTHNVSFRNTDEQTNWFHNIPSNQLFLIGETDVAIGVAVYTNIDWINRSLSISGSLYKEHRSCAYKAFCAGLDFAFEMLNMQRCDAEVLEYNIVAQKLEVDKLGFIVEGRRRQAVYKCGKYYDSIMLGMLRSEWQSCDRVKLYGDTCNENFSHDRFEKLASRFSR